MDEFEKRMHFSSFIGTLADTVTKMNPTMLVDTDARVVLEGAGLKDQYQGSCKVWLDMLVSYMKKASNLGSKYPIEEVLGIRTEE